MAPKSKVPLNVETVYTVNSTHNREWRVKLIILIMIALLSSLFGAWNVWRLIEAVRSPVISMKSAYRSVVPVPGVAICGSTLDLQPQCFHSAFNAADDDHTKGLSCDSYLTFHRMDASNFVNMLGFDNLTSQYCYVLNPSQQFNQSYGVNPLVFNNDTQKIALALWSSEQANNTLGKITEERWFFFGTFTENEDPTQVRFQIVKMPSISYLYFRRIERYEALKSDAIIGTGLNGNTDPHPDAIIEYETSFTSFSLPGFALNASLWELFRIIPMGYITDLETNTQKYPVRLRINLVDFTILQMAANMGGFISILSAAYFILFGSRRINPWGVVQRYILKNTPTPPALYTPTITSYSDMKVKEVDDNYSSYPQTGKSFQSTSTTPTTPGIHHQTDSDADADIGLPLQNVTRYQIGTSAEHQSPKSPDDQVHQEYVKRYSQTPTAPDLDDPRILKIRHELRAEVQRTIANELAKLRLFLSKYYLKDIMKTE
ncbi:972_t:CDS:2 [Diversispora eburnea]|uniref:972_t:CDS:1 n=1 Tax=Diversispora eburnea TaxID=1213867 RepID=A0A9N8W271_9GLOM|nr:972_t:CDS:2 [Diversispora eburnea]